MLLMKQVSRTTVTPTETCQSYPVVFDEKCSSEEPHPILDGGQQRSEAPTID
jgi:hypothetical protein